MKIALLGDGVMSRLTQKIASNLGQTIVGVVEPLRREQLKYLNQTPDAVIDFSHADNTDELCDFCLKHKVYAVIGSTGHTPAQKEKIKALGNVTGVVMSGNFSFGVHVLKHLAVCAAQMLGDAFDAEIVETHHRRKSDAPSGTALMLLQALRESGENYCGEAVFDRRNRGARSKTEVGVSTIRGGEVCGKHEICFLGQSETISLTHTALDREVFARGAVKAAQWLYKNGENGFFSMEDVIKNNGKKYEQ